MTYAPDREDTFPVPIEPAVLMVHLVNSAAETNVPIYIPWNKCRLMYGYAIVTSAIDGSGAMEIDLELDAADGTAMATVSVTASDAVGTVTELTISDEAACSNLSRADTSRDAINFEIDGSSGAAGEVDVILYFERSGC